MEGKKKIPQEENTTTTLETKNRRDVLCLVA
jgi:hypothetical protein